MIGARNLIIHLLTKNDLFTVYTLRLGLFSLSRRQSSGWRFYGVWPMPPKRNCVRYLNDLRVFYREKIDASKERITERISKSNANVILNVNASGSGVCCLVRSNCSRSESQHFAGVKSFLLFRSHRAYTQSSSLKTIPNDLKIYMSLNINK